MANNRRARAAAAPPTPAVDASGNAPVIRHQYDIPDEVRAALSTTTAEDVAEAQKDAEYDATMARTMTAAMQGRDAETAAAYGFQAQDETESLADIAGPAQASPLAAFTPTSAPVEPIAAVPPGQAPDPVVQVAPSGSKAPGAGFFGESEVHDEFEQQSATPEERKHFEQAKPEMIWNGLRARDRREPDAAQTPTNINRMAEAIGARMWSATQSFDWCRDAVTGHRHEFTYYFPEQHVLVDIYDADVFRSNQGEVRAEVAQKAQSIVLRNSVAEYAIGYIALVRGYVVKQGEIDDIKTGFVATELRVPDMDLPTPGDKFDSVRAASGDAISGAAKPFQARNWNRPAAVQ